MAKKGSELEDVQGGFWTPRFVRARFPALFSFEQLPILHFALSSCSCQISAAHGSKATSALESTKQAPLPAPKDERGQLISPPQRLLSALGEHQSAAQPFDQARSRHMSQHPDRFSFDTTSPTPPKPPRS
jgi:hypothetical protein